MFKYKKALVTLLILVGVGALAKLILKKMSEE